MMDDGVVEAAMALVMGVMVVVVAVRVVEEVEGRV